MAKKDKSFFGKIMGGNVTDQDEMVVPQDDYVEQDIEVEELIEEEPYGEEDQVVEQAPEVATGADKKEEDWMSDYEGALNIDMYQTKDNVIIKSTIAGVRPEDIDITVANDMVSIKGS